MLLRHAGIADTIIPRVFYAIPQQVRLRYVLKKELLMDPCLDLPRDPAGQQIFLLEQWDRTQKLVSSAKLS